MLKRISCILSINYYCFGFWTCYCSLRAVFSPEQSGVRVVLVLITTVSDHTVFADSGCHHLACLANSILSTLTFIRSTYTSTTLSPHTLPHLKGPSRPISQMSSNLHTMTTVRQISQYSAQCLALCQFPPLTCCPL